MHMLIHTELRKIMVMIDPAAVQHACVEKAIRIAAGADSAIELFVFDVEQNFPGCWAGGMNASAYTSLLRKRLLDEVEQLADCVRACGVHASVVAEWHASSDKSIESHLTRTKPGLVVKGASLRGTLTRAGEACRATTLLQEIAPALLFVHSKPWPARPVIAAAMDLCHVDEIPTALDEAVLNYGSSVANAVAGDLITAHPSRAADALAELTQECRAHILTLGSEPRDFAEAAQIFERLQCDLLLVKPRAPLGAAVGLGQRPIQVHGHSDELRE
jgi:hypothetical protein